MKFNPENVKKQKDLIEVTRLNLCLKKARHDFIIKIVHFRRSIAQQTATSSTNNGGPAKKIIKSNSSKEDLMTGIESPKQTQIKKESIYYSYSFQSRFALHVSIYMILIRKRGQQQIREKRRGRRGR
jgi:hypothetical protein